MRIDTRFLKWLRAVDAVIMGKCGMSSDHGNAWPSHACFVDGMSPQDAAIVWADAQDFEGLAELFEE